MVTLLLPINCKNVKKNLILLWFVSCNIGNCVDMASFAESSVLVYIYNKAPLSLLQDTATILFTRFLINVKS